jgi:hypothetical protein
MFSVVGKPRSSASERRPAPGLIELRQAFESLLEFASRSFSNSPAKCRSGPAFSGKMARFHKPERLAAAAAITQSSTTLRLGHRTTCALAPSPVTSTRFPRCFSIASSSAWRRPAFLLRIRRKCRSYIPFAINCASASRSRLAVCRSHSHLAAAKAVTRLFGAIRQPMRSAEKMVRENVPI